MDPSDAILAPVIKLEGAELALSKGFKAMEDKPVSYTHLKKSGKHRRVEFAGFTGQRFAHFVVAHSAVATITSMGLSSR